MATLCFPRVPVLKYIYMSTFEIFLFFHLVFLVVGFGSVIVVDTFGLFWILKWFSVSLDLVKKVAETTQKLIWLGFVGMLVTGIPMLVMKGDINNLTWVKLFLVAMVGVNGVFLHTIKKSMDSISGEVLPKEVVLKMSLASTVSQVGWWGALIIGYYNNEISSRSAWPASPLSVMLLVVCGVACFWAVGSLVLGLKNNSNTNVGV